ncbi:solute-binding protein [Sphaerisporangium rufum]|uniref:Solute-binding protein n=1 Tax=Sphaerisporangium rufum TaxID=1381558 RepID=A0A919R3K7_9ACTN|nr:ABC transporter substrate-binding protein [Sphaerisporangium rufum]GII79071.1 solute-binding protein [Sphaerisporangium rufum]
MRSVHRRAFLGAATGVSAALLTGCGTTATSRTAASGTPRRGGRLRVAFAGGGGQETLDPHLSNLFVEASRSKALFDKLADYGPDLSVRPRLAERWEPDPALTTWRVTLRQAAFHDGRPVRAADVLYSFARIADPRRAFRARAGLAVIDLPGSRAVDDRTVEFRLRHPYAEFPNLLAAFGVFVVPDGAEDFTRPVGSGPFIFTSFQPGRSLLLRRNPDHWDGAPYVDELQYLTANEESARIGALLGGQVDYAHDVTPTTARAYQDDARVRITRLPGSGMQAFAMKLDRPPFDDPRLREAMVLLADRRGLVDSVLAGHGQVGNDLFGKGYQHYAAGIPQRAHDPERARWLVRKAGAEGLKVRLDTSAAAGGFVESATVFAGQLRRAGLAAEIVMGDKDTYWTDVLDKGTLCCFRSGAMPIESHFAQRLLTTSTTNITKWRRPEFDALYAKAVSLADPGARGRVYAEMQRMQHAEGGYLVWGFADWLIAARPGLQGIAVSPANTLDWARFDKVWLA